jgi:hypothetical protein
MTWNVSIWLKSHFLLGPLLSDMSQRGRSADWFMVFNTAFNNISAISWQSVLLVEETGVPGENHRPAASH